MQTTKSAIPFNGTKEQELSLLNLIEDHKEQRGALMPVLQGAQDIYGYLPIEVQEIVALGLELSLEEVYGVATFYSQFTLEPKGKYKVSVCLGTACYVRGAGEILSKIETTLGISSGQCTADGNFSIEACRCIGACGLAPVMMINEDVYGRLTTDDIDGIIAKYKNA